MGFFLYKIGLKIGVFSNPGYYGYLKNRDPLPGHILLLHIQCCLVVINLFTRDFGH